MAKWLARRDRVMNDSGAALVAAVAVAIIGVMITVLVVSQAIVATNDSARDRVRTVAVHSAESGLDAMMSELANTAPCPGPDWSPLTVGEGPTATEVTVTVKYWSGSTALTCTAGVLSGVPTKAVVTSSSSPAEDLPGGIQPERKFEATVNLIPLSTVVPGAALFSASGFGTADGFQVQADESTGAAGVWIDSGNFECRNATIQGSLYVVDGSVTTKDGCRITNDLWVKTGYNNCCNVSSGWVVAGDVTVRNGNFTLNGTTRIQGALKVSGTVPIGTTHYNNSVIQGARCASNLPTQCTGFEDFTPRGLPRVDFDIADWQPAEDGTNFQLKYKEDLAQAVLQSWGLQSAEQWKKDAVLNSPCSPPTYMTTTAVKLPAPGSTTPTVFDMRDCGEFRTDNTMTLELYADIAFFAPAFSNGGQFTIKSGDGQTHRIWFIVPWGSGTKGQGTTTITFKGSPRSYTPGNIATQTGWKALAPIKTFIYTPKTVSYNTASTTYGQLYAGTFQGGGGVGKLIYTGIGVPGVNLTIPTGSAEGYRVEIINKRELKN
jgi:hypothetical protein